MSDVINILPNTSELESLQAQLKNMESAISLADSLEKLAKNRDFKKVIIEGFMTNSAAKSVRTSANYRATPELRESALASAQAAGALEQWMETISQMGIHAKTRIEEVKQGIVEVRGEDL